MYDISPQDFAHHVRHANSWNDLGVRCGFEPDKFGHIRSSKFLLIRQKALNMKLDTQHFHGQNQITDDDFKTIVRESNCLTQVLDKCKTGNEQKEKVLKRIESLGIDTTHFPTRRKSMKYKCRNKVDAIDEEIFKTLVNNNTTWLHLSIACGYDNDNGRKYLMRRCENLGLNTNHIDNKISADKVFVVDSQYTHNNDIKKRLLCDLDWVYECAACKNEHFTNCDGVLMWKKKKIVLQLEHKNGNRTDNRLENLEFLCPNCHSQTQTFCGGNSKKRKAVLAWLEEGKTSHVPGSISSLLN
jgi:hypothetical protein